MDISGFTNNIGVVIVGGVIVIIVAYFVFKPKSDKKASGKNGIDEVPGENATNAPEKTPSSTVEAISDDPSSPIKQTRRFLLDKMRSLKKPDILTSKSLEDNDQSADSEEEKVSSEMTSSTEDTTDVSLDVDEDNKENLGNMPEIEITDEDKQEIPFTVSEEETVTDSEEIEKTSVYESSDNSTPKADISTLSADDETEVDTSQIEAAIKNDDQLSEKPKGGGGVFDLFTEVEEEDNDISKFAANLDPVDINDLLREAKEIHKHIRR